MVHEVQGVIAREKGAPVEVTTILVPDPGPGERSCGSRPAVSATPICTTGRVGSMMSSRFFLAMRPLASSKPSGPMSAPSRWGTLSPQLAGGLRRVPLVPPRQAQYCFDTHNATQKMTLADGTVLAPAPRDRSVQREDDRGRRPVHKG